MKPCSTGEVLITFQNCYGNLESEAPLLLGVGTLSLTAETTSNLAVRYVSRKDHAETKGELYFRFAEGVGLSRCLERAGPILSVFIFAGRQEHTKSSSPFPRILWGYCGNEC